MSNTIKNNLPPVRRIVTGHNEQGMAKVWKDEVVPQTRVGNHSEDYVSFALPWTSNSSPADVQTVRSRLGLSCWPKLTALPHAGG